MLLEKGGSNIKYLASPLLASFKEIAHGFLTRAGGVSPEPFKALNFDTRDGDGEGSVKQNMARTALAFGFEASRLTLPLQVHGATVEVIDYPAGYMAVEADALLTNTAGLPIGVLTADCLPILLFDPDARAAAVIHAGWRGTAAGVAAKAVRTMGEFGARPEKIIAALGPHIRPCCYTVGEAVRSSFVDTFGASWDGLASFSGNNGDNTLTLDIARANKTVLIDSGLTPENIDNASECTSCRSDLFFSYRKEAGGGGGAGKKTGRQLSFIMLRE
jgi:YfiH family protein